MFNNSVLGCQYITPTACEKTATNYVRLDMSPGKNFTCKSSSNYNTEVTCDKAIDGKSNTAWMTNNQGMDFLKYRDKF